MYDGGACRSFFDTNVLLYMYDDSEPEKKARAIELFEQEVGSEAALLSTQVLQEFYVNATRKLAVPLAPERAEARVRDFATLPLVQVNADMILDAISRTKTMSISFWDALIVEAASAGGAKTLLTEDLNHGEVVDGLRIENPFI